MISKLKTKKLVPSKAEGLILKICVAIILMGFCSVSFADSIWNKESSSPYSTGKAYKEGDIINIMILESSQAQNKAGTDTDVKDDLGVKFTHSIQQLTPIIGANNQATGQLYNRYKGLGGTTRTSNVQARIAAWVTDVLENGNLIIKGNHKVKVNSEIQEITITGMVRPKDISGANSVYSYQVASAELSVIGTGAVAEAESPGWITRILNWL
ncbi:MAG: flagellar basal body L-ring protein FlgH, partial [Candidatus Margulisbacteria bacterium]|nr:flagellar basal body L-ring protein FlgH [Candidatus Margulisiibacteriota bacterium]